MQTSPIRKLSVVDPNVLPVMKPGERRDVIALRIGPFNNRVNVTTAAFHDQNPLIDFTWGYEGHGPHRFAHCILLQWTNGDRVFAEKYESEFVVEFLGALPDAGGTIPGASITSWLNEARTRSPKKPGEMIEKRKSNWAIKAKEHAIAAEKRRLEIEESKKLRAEFARKLALRRIAQMKPLRRFIWVRFHI